MFCISKKFLTNALSKKVLLIRYRWIIQKLLRKKIVENEKTPCIILYLPINENLRPLRKSQSNLIHLSMNQ